MIDDRIQGTLAYVRRENDLLHQLLNITRSKTTVFKSLLFLINITDQISSEVLIIHT